MFDHNSEFPVKTYPYRVYYADTDAGGVVYYAQYLRMFEQARTLYVAEYGLTLKEMEQKNNVFVCRHAELNYLSPALLDDEVHIHIQITEQGKASLTFVYEITSGLRVGPDGNEIRLVTGSTKMVSCKSRDGQVVPTRIAPWVQERLAKKAK